MPAKLTIGEITSQGSAELTDPTWGDLAHWLGVAGLTRSLAMVVAVVALAEVHLAEVHEGALGSFAGLPDGVSLGFRVEGGAPVYRIEWLQRARG